MLSDFFLLMMLDDFPLKQKTEEMSVKGLDRAAVCTDKIDAEN